MCLPRARKQQLLGLKIWRRRAAPRQALTPEQRQESAEPPPPPHTHANVIRNPRPIPALPSNQACMRASFFEFDLNLWPPFLFAGVHVTVLSANYRFARVELRQRPWNRNYLGSHFGSSLFAMTDPFWMLLTMHNLGRDYCLGQGGQHRIRQTRARHGERGFRH